MKKPLILFTALISLSFGAQENNAEQKEAAEKLVKVAEVRENIEKGFIKMLPVIEQRASALGLDSKKKNEFVKIYKTWFKKDIDKDKMVEKTVALYCKNFTTEELKELIAFYQTDLGRKFINKLPELNQQTAGFGVQEGQKKQPQLMARLKPFLEKNAPHAIAPPATETPEK